MAGHSGTICNYTSAIGIASERGAGVLPYPYEVLMRTLGGGEGGLASPGPGGCKTAVKRVRGGEGV